MRYHGLGKLAAVERFAARRRDLLKRVGQRFRAKQLSRGERASSRQKMLGKPRLVAEYRYDPRPLFGDDRADGEPIASIANRRLEQIAKRQLAEAL